MQTLEQIYTEYKDMVFNLALQYVQNIEDAEEIVQDVFLAVYDALPSFQQKSKLSTWMYRICINKSLDFLKARKRKKRFALITSIFGLAGQTIVEVPEFNHPGVELEQKEALQRVFAAINELPDQQKTALILLKIEGKSQSETAEIMNLTAKAVESLLQRAKKNLSKKINLGEGEE